MNVFLYFKDNIKVDNIYKVQVDLFRSFPSYNLLLLYSTRQWEWGRLFLAASRLSHLTRWLQGP